MQIQISWLRKKPTDLDLHCSKRQGVSGFSTTRLNKFVADNILKLLLLFFKNKARHFMQDDSEKSEILFSYLVHKY